MNIAIGYVFFYLMKIRQKCAQGMGNGNSNGINSLRASLGNELFFRQKTPKFITRSTVSSHFFKSRFNVKTGL